MIDTIFDFSYETDTDVLTLDVRDTPVTLVSSGDDFIAAAKEIKKARKKVKKMTETKTLTQTLTPVKFKKIKAGKRYRIEETDGSTSEFTADDDASANGGGTYYVDGSNSTFFSEDVKSVYLIENSEIS